ncbi:Stk1 family PASTA domain-containing Ser/Thr kinase [Mycolicibacterium neoaurum]|uniref:Stk1 family PASTA domain-containing Ser/Thr kinase n=1 Tax=Mycolicibacterium neoaurum TaxID=1795 RepID=UPI001F4D31F4|nr:PASTA domain-containing protein [Mycolicibacterium neoaurum]
MPFGIGGGAIGIRGGISTRGIGVGVGPLSAGTSWCGGGTSGGGGLLAWLIGAAILFFIAAWPFLLGTYIAVQFGAWNPSTERLVVGWLFEVIYIAGLVGWYLWFREDRRRQAVEKARQAAALAASGVVYEAKSGRRVIYRHGTCSIDHKSPETAASCRKAPPPDEADREDAGPVADAPTPTSLFAQPAVRWPSAIVAVGLIAGLVVLLVDPIHSDAEDAASKPCPAQASTGGSTTRVVVPDLVGMNAATAEDRLKGIGIADVVLTSANPNYKSVWVASNWAVVSTDPAPGCSIGRADRVEVFVTK